MLQHLQTELEAADVIDWSLWCLDGTNVRAHQAVAGAGKKPLRNEPVDHALGAARAAGAPRCTW
jgi:hypothetical protein